MSKNDTKTDISNIPYKHRTAAANMLVSKAGRLADLSKLSFDDIGEKEIRKAQQAISFYDMALLLMKPYDVNYQTVLHWKCLTLIEIGQFEEAGKGYEYLIRIANESEGVKSENATRDEAKRQLKKISGKKNQPIKAIPESEIKILDDPSFCWWAEQFCVELQRGKYKKARQYLSSDLAEQVSDTKLKESWLSLIGSSKTDVDVYLERYEASGESDEDKYIGWCYFIVSGNEINEAFALDIYQTESHGYEIRQIEFGRP